MLSWVDSIFAAVPPEDEQAAAEAEEFEEEIFLLPRQYRHRLAAVVYRLMLAFEGVETLHRQTFGLTGAKRQNQVCLCSPPAFSFVSLMFLKDASAAYQSYLLSRRQLLVTQFPPPPFDAVS